jgi:periplasmic copper chaperone A
MRSGFMRNVTIALAAFAVPMAASAHVVLESQQAPPGGYFKAVFAVPHGCDGSPTIALLVDLPPGVVIAKPMPKPGWTLDIRRQPLDRPIQNEGHAITERVRQVEWRGGRLSGDEYDTFTVMVRLPDVQGRLYFPVRQVCEAGETRWEEIPAEGKTSRDVRYPAPSVMVTPADAAK